MSCLDTAPSTWPSPPAPTLGRARRRGWRWPARLVLAALLLAASVLALAETVPPVIRFGFPGPSVGSPPRMSASWLAFTQQQRRIEQEFATEGVRVDWVFFKGAGPAVNEALTNGQLDFTALGDLPAVIGRSVGVETRLISTLSSRGDVYVIARSGAGVKGVADLRGRRVAFHKGTAAQLGANRVLARHGLSEKDLKVVNLDQAAQLAAFQSGDVDALFGAFNLLQLLDLGTATLVYDSRQDATLGSQTYILVTEAFAARHPQTTQRVVKALLRSAAWAADEAHRDEALRTWASTGAVSEKLYREQFAGRRMADLLSPLIDPFVVARAEQSQREALQFRLARKPFDVGAWIDRRFLDQAIAELGLAGTWTPFDAEGQPLGHPHGDRPSAAASVATSVATIPSAPAARGTAADRRAE